MDFEHAADILNMDLTGRDPGPKPNQRKYWPTRQAEELLHPQPTHVRVIPNTSPDEIVEWDDDADYLWRSPPDAWNESTDTVRDHTITIAFNAETELEAQLVASMVTNYFRRMYSFYDDVITLAGPS